MRTTSSTTARPSRLLAPLAAVGLGLLVTAAARPTQDADAEAGDDEVLAELRRAVDEIRPQVEAIRGLEFLRPVELRVASKEDLQAYIEKWVDELTTPEELDALDTVVKLLGLLPADQDLLSVQTELVESQVGGFYDPATDTFSLMESLVGGGLARVILAHELTHALDDQHFDLDGGMAARRDDADALWAYQAVVEGSATAVMNKWTVQQMFGGEGSLSAEDLEAASSMGADVLERMPPFLWKPMVGAYLRGAAFLVRSDSAMAGSMKPPVPVDIDRAFREPPRSSEQVLHPDRYWSEDERDDPTRVTLASEALPDGATLLLEDTLGELQLAFVVEPPAERKGVTNPMAVVAAKYTSPAATGWDGDRFALLAVGDARVLAVRTVWDSPEEAQEFHAALTAEALQAHWTGALSAWCAAEGLPAHTSLHVGSTGDAVWFRVVAGSADAEASAAAEALADRVLGLEVPAHADR